VKKHNLIIGIALSVMLALPSTTLLAQEAYLAVSQAASFNQVSANQSTTTPQTETQLETESANRRDGIYLDLGVGLVERSELAGFNDLPSGVSWFVNGRYQKKGFYLEFPHGSYREQETVLTFGYNFYNSENWSFDLHHSMNHGDLTYEFVDNESSENIEIEREGGSEIGLRIGGVFERSEVQFIVANASGAGGLYAGAWWTAHRQYQNFNFSFSLGAQYRNEKVMQYYYGSGVGGEEATISLPEYEGKAGIEYTTQISMSYPLSENFVLESFIRYKEFPSEISSSPVFTKDSQTTAAVLVKYVF
jgi:outer membrane scaffolding protein for murein synthesis (MipA/OmpV family)